MPKIGDTLTFYRGKAERHEAWLQLDDNEDRLKGGYLCYSEEEIKAALMEYLTDIIGTVMGSSEWENIATALWRQCLRLERRVIGRDQDVEDLAKRLADQP
jgi:hypothetical protein